MSLKKKIALGFILSAFLIALLAAFEYVNFSGIKKEIRFLEFTDTIRSKSLQLRRHEKNFFLYSPGRGEEESQAVHQYLGELDGLLAGEFPDDKAHLLPFLKGAVRQYRASFDAIEASLTSLRRELDGIKSLSATLTQVYPLVEIAVHERPLQAAEFLKTVVRMPPRHPVIAALHTLDMEIASLRKTGEDIIAGAKELDRRARENTETGIRISQLAILIIFPLFLVSGVVMLFLISRNIVSRLGLLTDVVEKTGRGQYAHVAVPADMLGDDEVGVLIRKFDLMEDQLVQREAELERKNRELLQGRKLAAIGTLAAGVAHELNNPLNNIHLSTQVLVRELGDAAPPRVREVASDILSQMVRVKKIVGDLLAFARGREPQFRETELNTVIRNAFSRVRTGAEFIAMTLDSDEERVVLLVDPELMEQVFINLFTNAADAMNGRGEIAVTVFSAANAVTVRVSDAGPGIPPDVLDKVFEPFYTTKEKGTGLGLAIVFNIVKKHGGQISVESAGGRGTTFTVTLPRTRS